MVISVVIVIIVVNVVIVVIVVVVPPSIPLLGTPLRYDFLRQLTEIRGGLCLFRGGLSALP